MIVGNWKRNSVITSFSIFSAEYEKVVPTLFKE